SVANFALASYGTTQSLQILERNLDLRPRLVVYGIIAHHFERSVWPCAPSYYEFCLDVSHVSWDDARQPYIALPFSDGVRRLLVFRPTNYYGPPAALPGIIDKVGNGIRYLDLTPAFERNRREGGPNPYIVGDGHPGVAGHALIAAEIAKYVQREGLLGAEGAKAR